LKFGQNLGVLSFRLRNLSPGTLTISAALLASEPAPEGQTGIVGTPPLLVRGDIDLTTLTHGYSAMLLNEATSWTLNGRDQEGSEVEVILGLDRAALLGNTGDFFGGILRFTDSLGFSQVDVGVSAEVAPSSGLWVGSAVITQVGQYLKSYVRDADNRPVADEAGRYQVENVDTSLAGVARTTSLRLIIHNPEAGSARLLQQVYFGTGTDGAVVLSNSESVLDRSQLDSARRLSAAHLPWSEANLGWVFDTALQAGGTLTTRVTTLHGDQASNPFLHTYHPDHDNRDARFASELPRGVESYDIIRDITLSPLSSDDDFQSRTQAGSLLTGRYQETIQLLGEENDIREFQVEGSFALQRVIESPGITFVNP
jgi:hypothetical protein